MEHILARGIIPPPTPANSTRLKELVSQGIVDETTLSLVLKNWDTKLSFNQKYDPLLKSLHHILDVAFVKARSASELGTAIHEMKQTLEGDHLSFLSQTLGRVREMLAPDVPAARLTPLPPTSSLLDQRLWNMMVPLTATVRDRWGDRSREIMDKRLQNLRDLFLRALSLKVIV